MKYAELIDEIIGFINVLIPAMFALVFVYFIWKMFDAWILHAGDPNKVQEGKTFALTAVIVLVVALSVWGIVAIIRTSFLGA
jgi:TRAP-type mannitol/chloroaromatic compound transport system permease small subunit